MDAHDLPSRACVQVVAVIQGHAMEQIDTI
eukprot:SAG11_NODE_24370_length_374_cov_0.934545_1_plen_29_part_01